LRFTACFLGRERPAHTCVRGLARLTKALSRTFQLSQKVPAFAGPLPWLHARASFGLSPFIRTEPPSLRLSPRVLVGPGGVFGDSCSRFPPIFFNKNLLFIDFSPLQEILPLVTPPLKICVVYRSSVLGFPFRCLRASSLLAVLL